MNSIESIKERNERRKKLKHDRKDEFAMLRELEYQGLVDQSVEDVEYLLNEVERLKGALEKIRDWGDDRRECYPLYNIAEEALKDT